MSLSRRKFLGTASCAAIGSVSLFSGLFNLRAASLLASDAHHLRAPQSDYKALVCILLAGGNDSFNMLVPTQAGAYQAYTRTRSNQALDANSLLPLQSNGVTIPYGLHPSMPEVAQLFNQENLAFISNVGTLVEPLSDRRQFENNLKKLPLGLFSHADQIMQWQTSVPQSRSAKGWGGRMADLLQAANASQDISMNISLAGNNTFQAGNEVVEYTISPLGNGSLGIRGYQGSSPLNQIRTAAVNNLLERQYQDIFEQTYADITRQAEVNHENFSAAVGNVSLQTPFSPGYLSQSMSMIARTIGAHQTLDMNRQTFFVTYGGWDHHDELLNNQAAMLGIVSKALGEFDAAMRELGLHQQVTTFTISDFARTLTSNGNGTDHGWGGNALVMGGDVKGGQMYGQYPELALGQSLDVGDGILIPTTATDEYFAELALWLGVSRSDLPLVLPNLTNFFDPALGTLPLGFMP
ncbi:MAG: DUF1501 domain-containing protein [Bacteroidota bacterium]